MGCKEKRQLFAKTWRKLPEIAEIGGNRQN
jgi:hypothetical protein